MIDTDKKSFFAGSMKLIWTLSTPCMTGVGKLFCLRVEFGG